MPKGKKAPHLPDVVYVYYSEDYSFLVGERDISRLPDDRQIGVYKLVQVNTLLVTRELVREPE